MKHEYILMKQNILQSIIKPDTSRKHTRPSYNITMTWCCIKLYKVNIIEYLHPDPRCIHVKIDICSRICNICVYIYMYKYTCL